MIKRSFVSRSYIAIINDKRKTSISLRFLDRLTKTLLYCFI